MPDTNFDELLANELAWAIAQKQLLGPADHADAFRMRVRVVGPHGEIADTPLRWASEDEKRRAMSALTYACEMASARAAIVTTDSRFLNVEKFCERFKIAPPTEATLDTFDKERRRVMKDYGHYMGNLPSELFNESLLSFAFGPRVQKLLMMQYRVVDSAFDFDPPISSDNNSVRHMVIGMIKPWWH